MRECEQIITLQLPSTGLYCIIAVVGCGGVSTNAPGLLTTLGQVLTQCAKIAALTI